MKAVILAGWLGMYFDYGNVKSSIIVINYFG